MPRAVPDFNAIRDALLRDLKNWNPNVDVSVDSDYYIRATSVASAVEGLYHHQLRIIKQIFPDTADAEYLELHAATRDLRLKLAVSASGTIAATGVPGTPLLPGLICSLPDGQYVSTAAVEIGEDRTVSIPAIALGTGAAGNVAPGTQGVFSTAPGGLDSTAYIEVMTGGVDDETHAELLARLLELIRRPPAGGNRYDYRSWAMSVSGVTNAYVYPLRRGLGTVDVAVTAGDGLPSMPTLVDAQEYIDDVRPVTAKNTLVFAPELTYVDIDVEVELQGVTLETATASITQALKNQFSLIAPAQEWVRSRSEAIISAVAGVADRNVILPAANVTAVVDAQVVQWLRLGAVTVRLME